METVPPAMVIEASELSVGEFRELLSILRANWKDTDPYLDDIARVIHNTSEDSTVHAFASGRIDGILRTKRIRSDGEPRLVPATFEQLVGPYWSRCDRDADTRILVDLTKRDGAAGVAENVHPLRGWPAFRSRTSGRSVPKVRSRLHTHLGAWPVRCIPNGRPCQKPPNVVVMSYRGFAEQHALAPSMRELAQVAPVSEATQAVRATHAD